jgi:orotate phosphoribosyltransferase-like protein
MTKLKHEQVKELRAQGLKFREIEEKLNMSTGTAISLFRYVARTRIEGMPKRGPLRDDKKINKAKWLRSTGLTFVAIGKEMGISKQAAFELVNK